MAHKTVFVSFDFENDKHYKYLLEAWDANTDFDFVFDDRTPREIQSWDIGRVKAALTVKIKSASYTLVIVGKEANKPHRDSNLIGHRNWINFEIYQSKLNGNKIVAVKLDRTFESPVELLNAKTSWAMSFTEAAIISALNQA